VEAIVFADRVGKELSPLTRNVPVSLLPVHGKPLIEHTLDDLAEGEVRSITLVVDAEHAAMIEAQLGDGERWGMRLEYARARKGETPTQFAWRHSNRLPENFLALRGDVYRRRSIRAFRAAANNVLATQVVAQVDGRCAQLCMCRQRDIRLDVLSWNLTRPPGKSNWRTIKIDGAEYSPLHDTTDFYLANVDGLDECVTTLNSANDSRNRDFFAMPGSRIRQESVRGGPVLSGSGCVAAAGAELVGPVVLGNDVYVDEGAFLHACVVLPGTYVPAGARLHNAVVTSEMAIGIDGGVICRFADRLESQDSGTARTGT